MTEKKHLTTLVAWQEWQTLCAVDLCRESVSAQLGQFARIRFEQNLERVGVSGGAHAVGGERAFHLFETFFRVGSGRRGKRYKKWLFARASGLKGEARLRCIEAGASLLMREVVREQLRRERAGPFMRSLEAPLSSEGDLTLEDLLPDPSPPSDALCRDEWEALARSVADGWFAKLDRRERLLVLAREYGISFSEPLLLTGAGGSRSQLHASYAEVVLELGRYLQMSYPDEGPPGWLYMARKTLEHLAARTFFHFFEDKRLVRFFRLLHRSGEGVKHG